MALLVISQANRKTHYARGGSFESERGNCDLIIFLLALFAGQARNVSALTTRRRRTANSMTRSPNTRIIH